MSGCNMYRRHTGVLPLFTVQQAGLNAWSSGWMAIADSRPYYKLTLILLLFTVQLAKALQRSGELR